MLVERADLPLSALLYRTRSEVVPSVVEKCLGSARVSGCPSLVDQSRADLLPQTIRRALERRLSNSACSTSSARRIRVKVLLYVAARFTAAI